MARPISASGDLNPKATLVMSLIFSEHSDGIPERWCSLGRGRDHIH